MYSQLYFSVFLLQSLCGFKNNIRKHDSTWEDDETFLTGAPKCHVVVRMLLTRCVARSANYLLSKAQEK